MAIADAVQRLRKARGWKQQELARLAHISQGMVSDIEAGKKINSTQETVEKLAKAFGLTVLEFYIEAGMAPPPAALASLAAAGVPDSELTELARIWLDLSPEDRETAMAVTRSLWERSKRRSQNLAQDVASEQGVSISAAPAQGGC